MPFDGGTNCAAFAFGSALFGAFIGYGSRILLAKQGAKRKEDWDQLRELTDLTNKLVEEAISFYCTKDASTDERQKKCIRIQRLISISGQKAHSLSIGLEAKQILSYQKRLRQAITMNEFDADFTREPLLPTDEKITEIERACSALVGALNMFYARTHRGSVNY